MLLKLGKNVISSSSLNLLACFFVFCLFFSSNETVSVSFLCLSTKKYVEDLFLSLRGFFHKNVPFIQPTCESETTDSIRNRRTVKGMCDTYKVYLFRGH